MIRAVLVAATFLPAAAAAEDWVTLRDDAAVTAALADRTLTYDAHTFQRFGAGGDTQYITERASDGRWAARGGQYCSVWPPSDAWACYDVALRGNEVRFTSGDRSQSVGAYAD